MMPLRMLAYCCLLLSLDLLATSTQEQLKKTGDVAYESQRYEDALKAYQALVESQPSADAYYNLGNAQYRTSNRPEAIRGYLRALTLDPNHEDAAYNLGLLRKQSGIESTSQSLSISEQLIGQHSAGTFAKWSLMSLWLGALGLALLVLRKSLPARNLIIASSALLLLMGLMLSLKAYRQAQLAQHNPQMVVQVAQSSVLSAPNESGTELTTLPAGSTVELVMSRTGWVKVNFDGTQTGWMPSSALLPVAMP